jgi:peptidoglycan/LPS O-acetylase OafA/YrhL
MTVQQPHLSHPKYRPDIDGLRAIAVLSVVAFHAFPSWLKGGFIGVDVFFVISGYLISTIIFENLDKSTFSFSEFYSRRIRRIFPALLLVLIACLAFGWFALLADEYKQLGKHIAAGAGFISNFILWNEAGYFDNSAETKPLLHLWSLGIEEQFYIVWPLLLWFAWKRKFNLLTITIIVAIATFILNLKGVKQDMVATFYSPQTRFWELLSGSLLAWFTLYKKDAFANIKSKIDVWLSRIVYSEKQQGDGKTLANVLSFVGLFLLLYGFWRINKELSFPGKWALVPVLGAVLIITAGSKAWVNRTILSNKIAVWFGLISFPLYLWHWPILSFARIVESEVPSRNIRIAAVALSIALAWLTYKLIERPLRFGNYSKVKVAVLVILMTIVGYFGYNTFERDGLPFRKALIHVSAPIERLGEDNVDLHNLCLDYYGISDNIRYCRVSIYNGKRPHIALIGDSHAASLYYGLSNHLMKNKEGLLLIGGRLFVDVATYPEGSQFEIDVYKGGILATNFVAKQREIDTVIMVSRGVGYIKSNSNYYLISEPAIKDRKRIFEIGMRKTLDLMVANKKKIIFVLDNPDEIGFNPEKCQDKRPLTTKREFDCSIPRAQFDARQKDYRELVLEVLKDYPSVILFDQAAYLCDEISCKFKDQSSVLYGDGDHLSVRGSEFMATKLIDVLNGAHSKILN